MFTDTHYMYLIAGFQAVRLSGGSEGQVGVFFNNTWKTICGQSWSKPDADVLCRQLGYPESVSGSETSNDKVKYLRSRNHEYINNFYVVCGKWLDE